MKSFFRQSLILLTAVLPMAGAYAHVDGAHSGGWLQNILHILQNADHLIIILAAGIVASLLVRDAIKKRR